MAKTDKLYKVLRIVLVTLAIMGCVFGLMKKVGLCADSSEYTREDIAGVCWYGLSPFTLSEIQAFDQHRISDPWYSNNHTDTYFLEIYNQDSNYYYIRYVYEVSNLKMSTSQYGGGTQLSALEGYFNGSNLYLYGTNFAVAYRVDKTTHQIVDTENWTTWYGNYAFYYYLPQTFTPGIAYTSYPFYCNSDFFTTQDGAIFLTQGGYLPSNSLVDYSSLQNVVDSTTEFSSDVADLVSSLPTDSGNTSVGQWLSNIFSIVGGGFQGLFYNIFNFFKPYLQGFYDFFVTIIDLFNDIKDNGLSVLLPASITSMFTQFYNLGLSNNEFNVSTFLHNLIFCSPARLNTIWTTSQTGQAVNSLKGCLTSVVNCYSATPSEHVYWRFDFSNTTLFSNVGVITINFDWYNSIRTPVITLFSVFFILGFLFLWIRKIPGIISGASSNSDDK